MKRIFTILTVLLTTGVFAQNNYSLQFDGVDDYVLLPQLTPSAINTGNSSTFLIQYKGLGALFAGSVTSAPVYPIMFRVEIIDIGGGQCNIKTYNRSDGNIINLEPATAAFNYDGTTWATLAIVIDNNTGNYILYNNGVKLLDYSVTPSSYTTPMTWHIGNTVYNGGGVNSFNGLIDNISIWDTALDSAQIHSYFDCPPTGSENNLYANWNFEEGAGTTASDLTSNANDGTLVN
ncbi:MAG: hypothetical protein HOK72_03695, partial [Flavobacteriales bacterium]|nr:hypothetical protein [Flavobacteriales bacterium]